MAQRPVEHFEDRAQAGRRLATLLGAFHGPDVVVMALPRGGVPVGFEVARALQVPLDVLVIRKIGVPGQEELAAGAVANGGIRVLNHDVVARYKVSAEELDAATAREEEELQRRLELYRRGRPLTPLEGKRVILVDDGLATGATMRAAVQVVKAQRALALVVAVPVAAPGAVEVFTGLVDEVVCAVTPPSFRSVGAFYEDFRQTTDEEVVALLERAAEAA